MDEAPASRNWAAAGWLLAVLALLLPWWRVSYGFPGSRPYPDDVYRLFAPAAPDTNGWAPHVTGALVVAVVLVLFVRLAAASWKHEPAAWRRDLCIATGLGVAALASTWLWPGDIPHFWGGRSFSDANATLSFAERARPGIGWWSGLLATLCVAVAAWRSRQEADGSTEDATTPK